MLTKIDKLFSLFDELCRKYSILKVESAGYKYLACIGTVKENQNSQKKKELKVLKYAEECIKMAKEMGFNVQIGINKAEVASTLIGNIKPQYVMVG